MARQVAASVQQVHIDIADVRDEIVWLATGEGCAILEVGSVNFAQLDEPDQLGLLGRFAATMNAVAHPWQILARVTPLDLAPYLADLTGRARREPSRVLAGLGDDHVAFLRDLAIVRALLQKKFYVAIPDEDPADGRALPRRDRRAATAPAARGAATRRINFRCEELGKLLGRCGLPARRLDDTAAAILLHDMCNPGSPAGRRLRDIGEYTGLTVRPAARATAPAAGTALPAEAAVPLDDAAAPRRRGLLGRLFGRRPAAPALDPDIRRLAEGTRSVADFIAPAAIERDRDWIRLDRTYGRTLAVTGYPATVAAGWLDLLTGGDEPLDIAIHLRPLDTSKMVGALTHKMVQLRSSALADDRAEKIGNARRDLAYEQMDELRDALTRGEERLFSVGCYLFLTAPTLPALDEKTARVRNALGGMQAESRPATFQQDYGFRSILPLARDLLRQPRNLETSTVASMFPFNNGTLSMDRGMLYGLTPHEHSLTIIDPFDLSLPNGNMFVCAMSGSGKSFFVKTMAVRNLLAGTAYIIVDPEDEYGRLCELVEGQYVRLALGSADTINPFDLPPVGDRDEGWRDPVAEQTVTVEGLLQMMLADELDGGARLTARERAVLQRAIAETYRRAGIVGADPASWARPAPLLDDLHAVLGEVPTATSAGAIADDLAARLEPYVGDGALAGLFNRPTSVDLGRRFVVFNIQGLDEGLHPLAIHTISAFVWRQVRRDRVRGRVRETMLVIDEAASLLRHEKGGAFLEDMARRARKYGLAQVTVTQKADDFLRHPHGNAVVSNAAITFLLGQKGNQIGLVGDVFGLTAQERTNLVGAPKGAGYLFLGDRHTWLEVEASPEEWRVASTSHRELADLAGEAPGEGRPDGRAGGRAA